MLHVEQSRVELEEEYKVVYLEDKKRKRSKEKAPLYQYNFD